MLKSSQEVLAAQGSNVSNFDYWLNYRFEDMSSPIDPEESFGIFTPSTNITHCATISENGQSFYALDDKPCTQLSYVICQLGKELHWTYLSFSQCFTNFLRFSEQTLKPVLQKYVPNPPAVVLPLSRALGPQDVGQYALSTSENFIGYDPLYVRETEFLGSPLFATQSYMTIDYYPTGPFAQTMQFTAMMWIRMAVTSGKQTILVKMESHVRL